MRHSAPDLGQKALKLLDVTRFAKKMGKRRVKYASFRRTVCHVERVPAGGVPPHANQACRDVMSTGVSAQAVVLQNASYYSARILILLLIHK